MIKRCVIDACITAYQSKEKRKDMGRIFIFLVLNVNVLFFGVNREA